MCWITKNNPIKQVAEEDIPVFKILKQYNEHLACPPYPKNYLASLCFNFEYKEQETYSLDKPLECTKDGIFEGFHSYSSNCKILAGNIPGYNPADTRRIAVVVSGENYILSTTPIYFGEFELIKVNCIIPKGSEYYLNEFDEYVSDKIKICNKDKTIE